MNEHAEKSETSWRAKLAAPLLAVVAVACCLGAPLIVGALGALGLRAVFGIAVGIAALVVTCMLAVRRLAGDRC